MIIQIVAHYLPAIDLMFLNEASLAPVQQSQIA